MGSTPEPTRTQAERAPEPPGPQPPSPGGPRRIKGVFKKVRGSRPPVGDLEHLAKLVRSKRPKADVKVVERAYGIAERAHEGQMRKSGDPFISHPVGVAGIVAELGLDESTVAAALLHDAVEDTELQLAEVEREMGYEIAALIDGVTKLDKIRYRSKEQTRAENLR